MSAAWVAGSVRARTLSRRRLGPVGTRSLAATSGLEAALASLTGGPYGRYVRAGQSLPDAQRAVAGTALWHTRVLAGWLPRDGAGTLRTLAGWFELANVDGLLAGLSGAASPAPFRLGSLSTAWARLADARSRSDLRERLSASAWGDPGGDDDRSITLGLRLSWAARVRAAAPVARAWAAGGAALLLARELARGRDLGPAPSLAARSVDADLAGVRTVDDLAARLSRDAGWALGAARTLEELATAERAWWGRLERDARAVVRSPRPGPAVPVATVALLAVDAWRVRGALALAARGGTPLEAFDALV